MEHYLSIIIGAGQAGLATAHQLTSRGLIPAQDFLLIDANPAPGGTWRHRWDSLTLGKAHNIASLPGMPAPLADASSPASHVVAAYYGAYEDKFQLRPYRSARVRSVRALPGGPGARNERGAFLVTLESGEQFSADTIVNATGTWDRPYIPYIPGIGSFGGRQLHTKDYSAAEDFAGQHVLVVGGGLSAVQFLLEFEGIAQTTWATRRAPDFTNTEFDKQWGLDVEKKVRERVFSGNPPASVVSTTGIPPWQEYLDAVERGVLVSRGMFDAIDATGVRFGGSANGGAVGGIGKHGGMAAVSGGHPLGGGRHLLEYGFPPGAGPSGAVALALTQGRDCHAQRGLACGEPAGLPRRLWVDRLDGGGDARGALGGARGYQGAGSVAPGPKCAR